MKKRGSFVLASATVVLMAILFTMAFGSSGFSQTKKLPEFTDVKSDTLRFMGYFYRIQLSGSEKKTLHEALAKLPAPCCSDKSALTC